MSRPMVVSARKACPCMKQVAGLLDSTGRRITSTAFAGVQAERSGVTANEQTRIRAVNIILSVAARERRRFFFSASISRRDAPTRSAGREEIRPACDAGHKERRKSAGAQAELAARSG